MVLEVRLGDLETMDLRENKVPKVKLVQKDFEGTVVTQGSDQKEIQVSRVSADSRVLMVKKVSEVSNSSQKFH